MRLRVILLAMLVLLLCDCGCGTQDQAQPTKSSQKCFLIRHPGLEPEKVQFVGAYEADGCVKFYNGSSFNPDRVLCGNVDVEEVTCQVEALR